MHSTDHLITSKSQSRNSKSQATSFQQSLDPRKRLLILGKQQRQIQRERVQEREEDRRKQEERMHKKQLVSELKRKRRELEQLERSQQGQGQQEGKAKVDAMVKAEKDSMRKIEIEIARRNTEELSRSRHMKAVKRLEKERQEREYKRKHAQDLRKTHCVTQQNQRAEAVQFSQSMEQREIKLQKRRAVQQEKAKQNLLRGLSQQGIQKKHIGIIVSRQNEEQESEAMKRAELQQERQRLVEQERAKLEQHNRLKAKERGREALQKLEKQRQYTEYCQQVAKDQLNYNLKRVQAGRQNQLAGVKPLTLSQMEVNKKLRGQQQFQQMFFKGKKVEKHTQLAAKYTIFQRKMIEVPRTEEVRRPNKKQPIDYMDHESLIPGVSEGHYSFQEDRQWEGESMGVPEQPPKELQTLKPIIKETKAEVGKNTMKQTRAPGSKKKGQGAELSYSESEEDSNI